MSSSNEQQKDSAATNADQPPPPQNTAGETVGQAVQVPTLTAPPSRRSAAKTTDSKGKKPNERASRSRSKNRPSGHGSRDSSTPKGPKTPPEKAAGTKRDGSKPPPKGSSEPTSTRNPSGFRIPKLKDARVVRTEKEEAAARTREKNLSSKNYAKATLMPHYAIGSHPLNEEEAEDWGDSRHPSEKEPPARRGGLVSSYVALGRNSELYKPKPKGTSVPANKQSDVHQSHKRSHESPPTGSDDDDPHQQAQQNERDRQFRAARSQRKPSVNVPSGTPTEHRSRANSGAGTSVPPKPPHHAQSRSRSVIRTAKGQIKIQAKIPACVSKPSSEDPPTDDTRSAGSKSSQKNAKKQRIIISKPAPDFLHPVGTIRLQNEASASSEPIPSVKHSLRVRRKDKYYPIVDANIRKDNILQTRDEFKKSGKQAPANWNWYNSQFRDENMCYELEFAISHFVHPASAVPIDALPVKTGTFPPTVEQCAADNELYPNEFIHGVTYGCHPAIAFFANYVVRAILKGLLACPDASGYAPVGIFTGLDFDSAASAKYPAWKDDSFRMYQEQSKVMEGFVRIALDFLAAGIRRPLCLLLRNTKKSVHKAIPDALEILRMSKVPNTFPIHLTNWSGSPAQAWAWLRAYPNTIFGITYDYVLSKTDDGTERFLQELPFANMVLESGCPRVLCDGNFATSVTCFDTAIVISRITGENHRHILAQTAWTSRTFFFPGQPRPDQWANTTSTQGNDGGRRRFENFGEKLLELDTEAANNRQNAASAARAAGGLPSSSAEELRKTIARLQFDKNNQPILDQLPEDESASIFDELMMDFSPNTESFQEIDIRRERAASGEGHLAKPATSTATDKGRYEPSGSTKRRGTSPPPGTSASAAADEALLKQVADLASRVIFPGGETLAKRKANQAAAQAEPEEAKGFERDPDDVVLEVPEFDDTFWDIDSVTCTFPLRPPTNPNQWSVRIPGAVRTYFEPLEDCHDHDANDNPHLRIEDAIPSYENICKTKGRPRPAKASTINRLTISSHGKMYFILWAARHHLRPRRNPEDKSEVRIANVAVLDFIEQVARHSSSELPRLLNRHFDAIRAGHTGDAFTEYDFQTAIMRWNDGCTNASAFFKNHASGPILYNTDILDNCRNDIRDEYRRVALTYFRRAMDWVRMRLYQVVMRFQRPWTPVQYVMRTRKENIVKGTVPVDDILEDEQVMFIDSWGMQFADLATLRPNVQRIRLSDLNTEALEESKKYFMGHLVRKVYWFHGASAYQTRTDSYVRRVLNVAQHFERTFPHVRFYIVLPPFTKERSASWHDQLHTALPRYRDTFQHTTVIMHPTDIDLCHYYDECARMGLKNVPWMTDEHTANGDLSEEGLRRRKEFMEVHYEVELWLQREHDVDAEREEEIAAQELAEAIAEEPEIQGATILPPADPTEEDDQFDLYEDEELSESSDSPRLHQHGQGLHEPSGPPPAEDMDTNEPSGSTTTDKQPYVHYWAVKTRVPPKEKSVELQEFYNKACHTNLGRKPHRYDYLQPAKPRSPKSTLEDLMIRAAQDAKTRKVKPAEPQTVPPNMETRQAEEHPSRPSTTDTTSDMSDATIPLKLPVIEPSGSAHAEQLLQSFRDRFSAVSTPSTAELYEQVRARLDADESGEFSRRFLDNLANFRLLGPSGLRQEPPSGQPSALLERLQLSSSGSTTERTTPLSTDESHPSEKEAQQSPKASSDAVEQAGHSTATDKDDSEAHLETDEESEDSDPFSGPSHGQDWD